MRIATACPSRRTAAAQGQGSPSGRDGRRERVLRGSRRRGMRLARAAVRRRHARRVLPDHGIERQLDGGGPVAGHQRPAGVRIAAYDRRGGRQGFVPARLVERAAARRPGRDAVTQTFHGRGTLTFLRERQAPRRSRPWAGPPPPSGRSRPGRHGTGPARHVVDGACRRTGSRGPRALPTPGCRGGAGLRSWPLIFPIRWISR